MSSTHRHPNSLENLKKGVATRFNSGDAAARGRAGGIAAAKTIRKRKAVKAVAKEILSLMPNLDHNTERTLEAMGFDLENNEATILTIMSMAYAQKAMKGDVRAGQLLLEMTGDDPRSISSAERLKLDKEKLKIEREKLELEKERFKLQSDRISEDGYDGPLICDSMEDTDDDPSA